MVVWVQNCGSVVYARDHGADWQIVQHRASLGKDQNSKFEVWLLLKVYCFRTKVKSKNQGEPS